MKILRDILLIIGVMALFAYSTPLLQISAGVVQSQNVEAPPVANDALMYWGNNGGNGLAGNAIQGLVVLNTDADWDTVVCGPVHCLAIKDGRLYTWGNNSTGKTGQESTWVQTVDTLYTISLQPIQLGSLTNWTCIGAGQNHSIGIESGRLYTWGTNTSGQLGQNNTTNLATPTQVGSDTNWTWCSAGNAWSAAIKGGQLLTCGSNGSFQTGLNTNTGNTLVFTVANSATTWSIASCGNAHGLAIRTDSLFSWGLNANGRTGQGTTAGSTQVPTRVGSLINYAKICAGSTHSLAIRNDSLYVFGNQQFGRLGNGNLGTGNVTTPSFVGRGYTNIAASIAGTSGFTTAASLLNANSSYAIRNDSLFGTGANNIGQLGIITPNRAVATFTLLDSVNFNYKKVAAHGGGGIAIRGN